MSSIGLTGTELLKNINKIMKTLIIDAVSEKIFLVIISIKNIKIYFKQK